MDPEVLLAENRHGQDENPALSPVSFDPSRLLRRLGMAGGFVAVEGPAAESLRRKLPRCAAAHHPGCYETWWMLVEKGAGERQEAPLSSAPITDHHTTTLYVGLLSRGLDGLRTSIPNRNRARLLDAMRVCLRTNAAGEIEGVEQSRR